MRASVRAPLPSGLPSGLAVVLLVPLVAGGCADAGDPAAPGVDALAPASANARWNAAVPAPSARYAVHLRGAEEVPAVDTRAQGQALLALSADGTELSYRLIVANIEDVFMAHIHRAPAGSNGAVVAWLYPSAPPPQPIPGRSSGVLADGVITAADLVGPLAGESLAALVAEIEAGNAYVNVHTAAHPGGEVRGQIR